MIFATRTGNQLTTTTTTRGVAVLAILCDFHKHIYSFVMDLSADDYTCRLKNVFDLFDVDKRGSIPVDHFIKLASEHFGASDIEVSNQEV